MANWRCGHARRSPLAGTFFAEMAHWPSFALATALQNGRPFPAELVALEVEQRRLKCSACRTQDRHVRRAWAVLALVALVVLLIGWRLHV